MKAPEDGNGLEHCFPMVAFLYRLETVTLPLHQNSLYEESCSRALPRTEGISEAWCMFSGVSELNVSMFLKPVHGPLLVYLSKPGKTQQECRGHSRRTARHKRSFLSGISPQRLWIASRDRWSHICVNISYPAGAGTECMCGVHASGVT